MHTVLPEHDSWLHCHGSLFSYGLQSQIGKLGTLMGVFVPCLQNILGIIFYIRFTWWVPGWCTWLVALESVLNCFWLQASCLVPQSFCAYMLNGTPNTCCMIHFLISLMHLSDGTELKASCLNMSVGVLCQDHIAQAFLFQWALTWIVWQDCRYCWTLAQPCACVFVLPLHILDWHLSQCYCYKWSHEGQILLLCIASCTLCLQGDDCCGMSEFLWMKPTCLGRWLKFQQGLTV